MTAANELMAGETVEREWNYLLFRDDVGGPDVVLQGDSSKREVTVEREWKYLLFRDGVEGPDVVLQGDSSKRVDGGGDSGERS